jgi:hypothetical protein
MSDERANTWAWTEVNVGATSCGRDSCSPCQALSEQPQRCRIMHASVPLDGLVHRYFSMARISMFRPLGVGNRGGTSGLEISNEDLAALEEAEDEDDGEAQLCKLRLSIEQLEQALNIVFWRARAGLAFSKLKVHADGPHQQNKLLIRLGSVSSFDIWHDKTKAYTIEHPGPAFVTLIWMDNWHCLPHGFNPRPSAESSSCFFLSLLFKLSALSFEAWVSSLGSFSASAVLSRSLHGIMDEKKTVYPALNFPGTLATFNTFMAALKKSQLAATQQQNARRTAKAKRMGAYRYTAKCDEADCGQECYNQKTLARHKFLEHMSTEEKREYPEHYHHRCPQEGCGHTFDRAGTLARHLLTHQEREQACPLCSAVVRDLNNHLCPQAPKVVPCRKGCGKTFSSKPAEARHANGAKETKSRNASYACQGPSAGAKKQRTLSPRRAP